MPRKTLDGVRFIGMEPTPTGEISHMRVEIHDTDEISPTPTVVTLGADAVDILIQHDLEHDGAFRINVSAHGIADQRDLARLLRHYAAILDDDHAEEDDDR